LSKAGKNPLLSLFFHQYFLMHNAARGGAGGVVENRLWMDQAALPVPVYWPCGRKCTM
jgi:hypothetical protein